MRAALVVHAAALRRAAAGGSASLELVGPGGSRLRRVEPAIWRGDVRPGDRTRPRDYGRGLLLVLAAIWLGAAAALVRTRLSRPGRSRTPVPRTCSHPGDVRR